MTTITNETMQKLWSEDRNDEAMYLCDLGKFRENVRNMRIAFESRYSFFDLAYSLKTNYVGEILRTAKSMGVMAEVVSAEEYLYALSVGFERSCIVFNGVAPAPMTKVHAAERGIVNVDNYAELRGIVTAAVSADRPVAVGIRLNIDVGNGVTSRFGVELGSPEFQRMTALIGKNPDYVRLIGFHCHIGNARPVRYWRKKVSEIAQAAKAYDVNHIDIGGGMYGPMPQSLAEQFDEYEGDYNAYAEVICDEMNRVFPDKRCHLIVEPGTALVGNVMDMAAGITSIKKIRGKTFVTVTCNSNQLGFVSEIKDLPVEVLRNPNVQDDERIEVSDATVCGNTCLEFDYLKKGFCGTIGVGDRLLFKNVGAYSISSSRQFIVPRPAVIDAADGTMLRQTETYYDMFEKYMKS